MDRRLALELLPAAAFLLGNALGGRWIASGAALVATALSVTLLWQWEHAIPCLALSALALSALSLAIGLIFEDTAFLTVRPTFAALASALVITAGMLMRPSLLRRTFGHKLELTAPGWQLLHLAWIGLALLAAATNEVVRRTMSEDVWAAYHAVAGPVLFGLYWVVTYLVADWFWDADEDEEEWGPFQPTISTSPVPAPSTARA